MAGVFQVDREGKLQGGTVYTDRESVDLKSVEKPSVMQRRQDIWGKVVISLPRNRDIEL